MRKLSLVLTLVLLTACVPGNLPDQKAAATPATDPLPQGIWMKGDLHLHSNHSTDALDNPLPGLVKLAEDVGMDYFLITDHDNHVNGDVAHNTWTDPAYHSDSMVVLYGAEWTTDRGHATAVSPVPYDHQRLYDVRDNLDTVIGQTVKDLNIHFSANHPASGDAWDFSYDMVDSLEVWSTAIWSTNDAADIIWDDLLKSGRPLTGRGGSDAHHAFTPDVTQWTTNVYQGLVDQVGTPTTWVYARERTGAAVIEALDHGHVAVSANPDTERIELYADTDNDGTMDLMMGDIAQSSGQPVHFRVDIVGGSPLVPLPLYSVKIIKNGAELDTLQSLTRSVEFIDTPETGKRSYYRVEVKGVPSIYPQTPGSILLSGRMIGFSNPIYFNFVDSRRSHSY